MEQILCRSTTLAKKIETAARTWRRKGALKKVVYEQPQKKKGGRKRQCPTLCEVCLRPSNPALLPAFSHQGPSNDCPCAFFARFWLSNGCLESFQARPVKWKSTVLLRNYRLRSSGLFRKWNFSLFLSVWRRRSRCPIRCPVHALDFHHFGKPREDKVRFVRVLQSPPLPLPLKSRVCRCLQSVPSPWKCQPLEVSSPLTSDLLLIQHCHRWAVKTAKWEISGMGERGWSSVPLPCHQHCHWVLLYMCAGVSKICRKNLWKSGCRTPLKHALMSFL